MLRVEGNRGITDAIKGPSRCRENGCAWEEPIRPTPPIIGGSRPANIGTATVGEAANLSDGNDGGAKRKAIWLNFGLVLTRRVGIRIGAELDNWHCCKGEGF